MIYLKLADDGLVHLQRLGQVEHHNYGEGAKQQLPGEVYVVDGTTYGDRSLLDGRDVGIPSIREDDGRVGSLHDYLQINVPLPQDSGVVLGRDLHRHHYWHAPCKAGAQVIHQQQGSLLHPRALPLTTFDHHAGCVEILLLLSEHDLYIVLVLNGSQVRAVGIRSSRMLYLEAWHDRKIKVKQQRGQLPNSCPGPLHSCHLPRYGNLVTLLIGIAPVAVREVDMAVSLRHYSPDCVSALADNVGVVCVAYVHLHSDSAVGCSFQNLGN